MRTAANTNLARLFQIGRRFQRSVDLERDILRPDALEGYVLTPLTSSTFHRVLDGLRPEASDRAWTLTGPYGAGKSAFALFLASVLGKQGSPGARLASQILKTCDHNAYQRARILERHAPAGFCRIVVGGARAPLLPSICRGVRKAVHQFFGQGEVVMRLNRELSTVEAQLRGSTAAEDSLCLFLDRLAKAVVARRGLGILMVVDELGKFLEYASGGPREYRDVFLLQRLAENAARSGAHPFVVITMLHQAFDRYAAGLPASGRDEWAKIQGRFEDVAFLDSPAQILALAAKAIKRANSSYDAYYRRYDRIAYAANKLRIAPRELRQVLRDALPLHPTVSILLPAVFRSALAQHERSLFTFLTSKCDGGFVTFLEESAVTTKTLPLYRLDRFYDFFAATLGPALFAYSNGKRWAEIDQILARWAGSETPLAERLIKAVGLLGLFGSRGLRASRKVLSFALEDERTTAAEIRATLDRLVRNSVLVYRPHSDAFALWEGSDIDLEDCVRSARAELGIGPELIEVLETRASIRPWVARRHFIESGTMRHFEVRFVLSSMLQQVANSPLGEADGRVAYVLPADCESHDELLSQAIAATKGTKHFVVAVPHDVNELVAAASELRAWDHVRYTVPDLAGDRVARRELAARIDESERRLDRSLQHAFGFGELNTRAASTWVAKGVAQNWKTPKAVSHALSTICDEIYSSAPLIRNELLNRRALSSAAAAARRTLLEAMIVNGTQSRLGFVGNPAELSMYASLLEKGGLHTVKTGGAFFGPPPPEDTIRLKPTWDFIERFLEEADGPRSVGELQKDLEAPPYGLRAGPFFIIFVAALLSFGEEVALFEEGTFVPEISGATAERLLRSPARFQVARFRISGARAHALSRLATSLPEVGTHGGPLEVVRALCRRAAQLPAYTKSTKRLTDASRAVRDRLLQARDPLRLLFVDLPAAVGMHPIDVASDDPTVEAGKFAEALSSALGEIAGAYSALMSQIQAHLADALELAPAASSLRDELSSRSKSLERLASDPKLKSFVLRATDETLGWDGWLESIATLLGGRPPTHWSDADLTKFESSLAEIAALFLRAEDLALEGYVSANDAGVVELLRVSVASPGGMERRRLVRVRATDEHTAAKAQETLERMLDPLCEGRADLQMAVLARVLQQLIARNEQRPPAAKAAEEVS